MDFTLTPTNYSGRGVMIDGQFRYKSDYSDTEIEFTQMDKDDIRGESRHAYYVRDDRVYKNTLVPAENGKWTGSLMTSKIDIGGISDLFFL